MDKFKNKYRIESNRLKGWDYLSEGMYFITICTQNREHFFGKIIEGKMHLSQTGVIADILWHEIKNYTKNVELDTFVVMPNHIHGILILKNIISVDNPINADNIENNCNNGGGGNGGGGNGGGDRDVACNVSTDTTNISGATTFVHMAKNETMAKISPKSGSVGRIIGSYKSAVTKHANRLGYEFAWQPNYHDHIIRNDQSFKKIQNYIRNNPAKWDEDTFF